MSECPEYSYTFKELVEEVLQFKGWKQRDLEEATCFTHKTMNRCLNGETFNKQTLISICVALGIDLVLTMIFLMSRGILLNPITNEIDNKYMIFISKNVATKNIENKGDGFDRIIKCNEFIQERQFFLGGMDIK